MKTYTDTILSKRSYTNILPKFLNLRFGERYRKFLYTGKINNSTRNRVKMEANGGPRRLHCDRAICPTLITNDYVISYFYIVNAHKATAKLDGFGN